MTAPGDVVERTLRTNELLEAERSLVRGGPPRHELAARIVELEERLRLPHDRVRIRDELDALGFRSPDQGGHRGPDFLVISPPKSASNWLKLVLHRHSGLRITEDEPRYFSDRFDRPVREYLDLFRRDGGALKGGPDASVDWSACVVGEKTPFYFALPDSQIAFLHELFPRLRLVAILRDPVARAWSHATSSFDRIKGEDILQVREKRVLHHFRMFAPFGWYTEMLRRWERHFGPEQLMVASFREVAEDPRALVERVLEHIGAPGAMRWDACPELHRPVFAGRDRAMPRRYEAALQELFADELARCRARFGEDFF